MSDDRDHENALLYYQRLLEMFPDCHEWVERQSRLFFAKLDGHHLDLLRGLLAEAIGRGFGIGQVTHVAASAPIARDVNGTLERWASTIETHADGHDWADKIVAQMREAKLR